MKTKRSNRVLSGLLALVMALSLAGVPAFADEPVDGQPLVTPDVLEKPLDSDTSGIPDASDVLEVPESTIAEDEDTALGESTDVQALVKGSVRVLLSEGMVPEQAPLTFLVGLEGSTHSDEQTLNLTDDPTSASQVGAYFENLEEGSYRLSVSGAGFATYYQDLTVTRDSTTIALYAGAVPVDESADGKEAARAGIILFGNVNSDDIIDDQDASELIDAIEAGSPDAAGLLHDLNYDGVVSLADLQLCAESVGVDPILATVATSLSSASVEASVAQDVSVASGSLASLVGGGESVVALKAENTISNDAPLALTFDLMKNSAEPATIGGLTVVSPPASDNTVDSGTVQVEYVDENGDDQTMNVAIGSAQAPARRAASRSAFTATATRDADGTIVVDFGGQIAVKKVTLVITGTSNKGNLAEISKVEFLNDMESRIPAPEMNVPTELSAVPRSKRFALSWKKAINAVGYEVSISDGKTEEIRRTSSTKLEVTGFGGAKIKNGTKFTVKVQSVNGTWRSGYSEAITVVPKTESAPDAPDGLQARGVYRGINVSWKNMDDTDSYNLFYRVKNEGSYTKLGGIEHNSYQLADLKDNTEYQIYVTGVNDLGESGASVVVAATTANVSPAQLPSFRLINTKDDRGYYLNHITNATHASGSMIDSVLDASPKTAFGLFDNDYSSYLKVDDWDDGAHYPSIGSEGKGITVTFDEPQTLGIISLADIQNDVAIGKTVVQYLNEAGKLTVVNSSVQTRTDQGGRRYSLIKLSEPVTSTKFQIGYGQGWTQTRRLVTAEMRFHAYDRVESDIMDLYTDDLHIVLREGVDTATIDALQQRLDTPDPASGEYHPYRSALQTELDAARKLLATTGLNDTVSVHSEISPAFDNRNLGVSGLNAWQPLGEVAGAGDEIVVYVGAAGKTTGAVTSLRLVAAQQHPSSGGVAKVVTTLRVGRNEITIPQFSSIDVEKGGQLYVEYTGGTTADAWGVRVSGAQKIPTLDLYQITDPAERMARTKAYVEALEVFVPSLQAEHEKLHQQGDNTNLRYPYAATDCITNATDILLDQMMYSAPAQQILAGAGGGSVDERATKLLQAFDAMDQMMELFYQHKGLAKAFDKGTASEVVKLNSLPYQHLNIRYTRMFAGAFMYAAGNHIGIEWGSVPGLSNGVPVTLDGNDAKVSGQYFGWGIAHEIGHNINQPQYTVPEETNNYFAQLARTDETNETARFNYEEIYQHVTSGGQGFTGGSPVHFALYWQLRLAYDNATAFKMYETYQQMFDNRLFARIDSYARNPQSAPQGKEGAGVALALDGGTDQVIMRLASAAAERNLTEFFTAWGMVPNEATKAYVEQFAPETRAITYISDDARAYARTHKDTGAVADKDVVQATAQAHGGTVSFLLDTETSAPDSVLGYEITRVIISDGQRQSEVVGFSVENTFEDNASALSGHVVTYEVRAVDKFLNRSNALVLDAIKIDANGQQDKTGWSISTNMVSDQDTPKPEGTDDNPDATVGESAARFVIDGSAETVYTGSSAKDDPFLTIDMGSSSEVTSVLYALTGEGVPFGSYRVEISQDGQNFTSIKQGTLELGEDGSTMLYFDNGKDPWICTYDARYLRITAVGQAGSPLSVGEIDVFGPTGDNIEFLSTDEGAAIGILKEKFVYQPASEGTEEQAIPQGSVIFTGLYKGNPAYNVVVLYDGEGSVVGGADAEGNLVAQQIILAENPKDALLGNTSEGRWVYWIEPPEQGRSLPTVVRAELYRVDNALTNVGQRLVSDTLPVSVPKELPEIVLQGSGATREIR